MKPAYIDIVCIVLLALLAIFLFRSHFFGDGIWIGNPDRLNSDLKILAHYLSGKSGGHLTAWNDHEMMGYDSFILPYTFPNPLVYLVSLFGENNLFITMGYISIALLALSGITTYIFLRADFPAGLPALIGALCYEFSSLTLLKVSQNSMSFAVFLMIPLIALAIRKTNRESAPRTFLVLALLIAGMLSLMFLQKAVYALMLTSCYAVWRSLKEKSWFPFSVFSLASVVAIIFALPRLIGIAKGMLEYARTVSGLNLKEFDIL